MASPENYGIRCATLVYLLNLHHRYIFIYILTQESCVKLNPLSGQLKANLGSTVVGRSGVAQT